VTGGGIAIAVVLVVVLPVAMLATGAIGTIVVGWLLRRYADESHEGSELLETNY
jgi:hypothetical protein